MSSLKLAKANYPPSPCNLCARLKVNLVCNLYLSCMPCTINLAKSGVNSTVQRFFCLIAGQLPRTLPQTRLSAAKICISAPLYFLPLWLFSTRLLLVQMPRKYYFRCLVLLVIKYQNCVFVKIRNNELIQWDKA